MNQIISFLFLNLLLMVFVQTNSITDNKIEDNEVYETNEIDFLRSIVKYDSNAIELLPTLDHSNYYGSCLIEGIPHIEKGKRLVGNYIIKFDTESDEECWCRCLGFDGCYASLFKRNWGCHLYDLNYKLTNEEGFTSYLREKNHVKFSSIGE